MIFFVAVFIQMLAEIVLKGNVVLICKILKGKCSSLDSLNVAKIENESKILF